ncbi:MAG: hypothetical protein ACR2J6_08430 [Thermoleophilaceae bacterium]
MSDKAKFTLRFQNSRTHELLGVIAAEMGVSKNQLAEQMLERELSAAALLLESDLVDTIARLRDYRRDEHLDRDIQEFAEAEAYERDPLRSRMVEDNELQDAFGVAEVFSS